MRSSHSTHCIILTYNLCVRQSFKNIIVTLLAGRGLCVKGGSLHWRSGQDRKMSKGRAPREFVPDYTANVSADFELWLEDLEDYLEVSGVTKHDEKKRLFLNLAGLAIRRIVKGLQIPTPAPNDDGSPSDVYKPLKDALRAYFRPSVNATAERHKFRQLHQHPGESVTSFVGRLRE